MYRVELFKGNPKFFKYFKDFIYSPYFALSIMITSLISYLWGSCYLGLITIALSATIILLFLRDVTPLIIPIFFVTYIFRDFSIFNTVWCIIILAPVAIALVLHFILYPVKNFKLGGLSLAIAIVCLSLFLGGLLSKYIIEYPRSIANNILIGPLVLIVYLLFINYIEPPEYFDLKNYFCSALVCLGILMCAEIYYFYYHHTYLKDDYFSYLSMGWGNKNGSAMVLLITIPAVYYYLAKSKYVLPYVFTLAFFYLAMYLSNCDGCLAILCAFTPFILLFLFIRTKRYKKRLVIIAEIFVFVFLAFILCILKPQIVDTLIGYLLNKTSDDNLRSRLYREGWALFLKNPLFGAGMGYYNDLYFKPELGLINVYYFHSTLFQTLGCLGLVGVFAYVYYYIARYKILLAKNTSFNLYTFYSFTMITCYGFIDTCEFSIIPTLLFMTILLAVVEVANNRSAHYMMPSLAESQTSYFKPCFACKLNDLKK